MLKVTPDKYIVKDGLKICRIDGEQLVFHDRNNRRGNDRRRNLGDADVRIDVLELVKAVVGQMPG